MRQALAVAAKAPQPGKVKTRLHAFLSDGDATELYRCFLKDTIALMEAVWEVDLVVSYTPEGGEPLFHEIASNRHRLLCQRGDHLGERLYYALEDLLGEGYEGAAIMDSDSPTLPAGYLRQAFRELARPGDRVVLGPAVDGGYYLIGIKRPHRRLFEEVAWSGDEVLAQTMARAREIELEVALLPEWYDVDDMEGLRRLVRELTDKDGHHAGRPVVRSLAPESSVKGFPAINTRRFILARWPDGELS